MSIKTYTIREIQANDNEQIAKIIREVLIEFGVPKVGTAYEDTALDIMFETYNIPDAAYYVITDDSNIIGGAGIMQLQNTTEKICELQKMYFSPIARGKGFGSKIMETCLEKARQLGFEKCYLETLPYMKNARKLYHKVGFESLNAPLGDTGHYSCNMWMLKDLKK
ncbi:GNAT family N-acetyltransferase [Urechidicola croceus]|uniref:GNAT family N-acetyltransferase n=1 Tax=Urechidicola croceus TaxID=1850246 RepID=A0A1D8PBI8_9FLAO|nr:GNAT family N-acetyltransferase [Urechidicola croceus]